MIHLAYSIATGRVRGWTVFSAEEAGHKRPAGPGEAVLILPQQNGDLHKLQALVSQTTGKTPVDDRYVIVDRATGKIMGAVIADPQGCKDKPPQGCDMYQHSQATPEWTFDPALMTLSSPMLTAQEIDSITAAKLANGIRWIAPPRTVDTVVAAANEALV